MILIICFCSNFKKRCQYVETLWRIVWKSSIWWYGKYLENKILTLKRLATSCFYFNVKSMNRHISLAVIMRRRTFLKLWRSFFLMKVWLCLVLLQESEDLVQPTFVLWSWVWEIVSWKASPGLTWTLSIKMSSRNSERYRCRVFTYQVFFNMQFSHI